MIPSWFHQMHQNCLQLAAAGFYKCNTAKDGSDECVCFYCGKTLGDWDAEDDPFKEHKDHSPKCQFINLGRRESELKVGINWILLYVYWATIRLMYVTIPLKVNEFLKLVDSWCSNQMNKSMDSEADERSKIFNKLRGIVEAKFRK